jgi:signal transduction histidine kinase
MPLPIGSVRARLTLWYALALSVPLTAFAFASYVTFSRALYGRTDAFINDALSVFSREVTSERRGAEPFEVALRQTLLEVRFAELDIMVFEPNGALIAKSEPHERTSETAPSAHPSRADAASTVNDPRTIGRGSSAVRVRSRAYDQDGHHVLIAGVYPLREVAETLGRIRAMFVIVIPLLILASAGGGWFLAKRSLAPAELAYEQQRRFMADASHELRTPSAVMRAEADVTLSRPQRTETEYRASLEVVRDAARRLTRIVDDIFLLARADAGHLVMQQSTMDLADVVVDSVRAIQAIAADRQVRIDATEITAARMHGDADLLGRILLNLLDNALRHTPENGAVTVRMTAHDGLVDVRVADPGPGIPPEAHDRVFERFFRLDRARSREERATSSGAGLGLAIARRIAEMHGGSLTLAESRPGRTEFLVVLPVLGPSGPTA